MSARRGRMPGKREREPPKLCILCNHTILTRVAFGLGCPVPLPNLGLVVRRSVLALAAALVAVVIVYGAVSRPPAQTPPPGTVPSDSHGGSTGGGGGFDGGFPGGTGSVGSPSVRPSLPPPEPPPPPRAAVAEPLSGMLYWDDRNFHNLLALYFGAPSEVLFLGDSITDFLAHGSGQPLWDAYYRPLGALDFGVASATTSHVLWQVESGQVALAEPRVIVLMIGSNNLADGESPVDVAAGIEKIVRTITAQLPKTQILLLSVLPRGAAADDPVRTPIVQTNQLLAALESDRVTYLDIGGWFIGIDGSIPTMLMADGIHPTTFGYLVYSFLIWDKLMGLYSMP
jgi:lysophospholipase L1-like esterase